MDFEDRNTLFVLRLCLFTLFTVKENVIDNLNCEFTGDLTLFILFFGQLSPCMICNTDYSIYNTLFSILAFIDDLYLCFML